MAPFMHSIHVALLMHAVYLPERRLSKLRLLHSVVEELTTYETFLSFPAVLVHDYRYEYQSSKRRIIESQSPCDWSGLFGLVSCVPFT